MTGRPGQGERRCCLLHDWGIERGYRIVDRKLVPQWFRGVPDAFVGSAESGLGAPQEKVCGRCGRRKRLRWRIGLTP